MVASGNDGLLRLLPHHREDLGRSGLNEQTIEKWGPYSVERDQPWVMSQLGFPHLTPPALALPVLSLDVNEPNRNFCVLKPDAPRRDRAGRVVKYESPKNFANRLHVPFSARQKISDPSVPLVITEGQKKAEAAAQKGICAVALFGVNNWLSRVGDSSFPIADFDSIALGGRRVVICFDSDAAQNAQVRRAERDLARFLSKRGALVFVKRLPPGLDGGKTGVDDFLLRNSVEQFWALPEQAPELDPSVEALIEELVPGSAKKFRQQILESIATEEDPAERARLLRRVAKRLDVPLADLKNSFKPVLDAARGKRKAAELESGNGAESADPGPYRMERGCFCIEKMKEYGPVLNPLCNFVARIREEIILDDGTEPKLAFSIDGQLNGDHLPTVRVPAATFAGMNWITEQWGSRAIISAGTAARDQLREAIQRFSPKPARRQVFQHTGWRKVGDSWIFLTSAGAIGNSGVEVDLGPDLQCYQLPSRAEDPIEAIRLSLSLLAIAPWTVSIPLWAAMYRAPLASALSLDFSLWILGPTGALKSTLSALFLCHFGEFTSLKLPGSWSSTANQLERRSFVLKDLPFVIDDFAPSALDSYELQQKASLLLRAQGNSSGRGRLRADLTERPTYRPRGLIVATGEECPFGGTGSVLARTVFLEVERSMIDLAALSRAQERAHRLPHAMCGYIAWLAADMEQLPGRLRTALEKARTDFTQGQEHLRQPQILANLWLGLDCGLAFAEDRGALTASEGELHRERGSEALVKLGQAQSRFFEVERPVARFARILYTLLAQRQVELAHRESVRDRTNSRIPFLGWFDAESLFLIPEGAHQAVALFCRNSGEPFPLREETLFRDFKRSGVSVCSNGRCTATVRIGGQPQRVLELRLDVLGRLLGQDFSVVLPRR